MGWDTHAQCALQEKSALVKGLQAAAASAIRRGSAEGSGAAAGSMEGSQRAIIGDLSRKVADLSRQLAQARRQQYLAEVRSLTSQAYQRCLVTAP